MLEPQGPLKVNIAACIWAKSFSSGPGEAFLSAQPSSTPPTASFTNQRPAPGLTAFAIPLANCLFFFFLIIIPSLTGPFIPGKLNKYSRQSSCHLAHSDGLKSIPYAYVL